LVDLFHCVNDGNEHTDRLYSSNPV
jgi:hypothetical protein